MVKRFTVRLACLLCVCNTACVCAGTGIVAAFHPEAARAGIEMLTSGGNAFDAFVAATFADYVVSEGGTSAAGSLGALVYHAGTGSIRYLDAEFNSVSHPSGYWDSRRPWSPRDPESGKAVLVPGAVAGLEALSKRYGRKHFAEVLQPAIKLARDGFRVQGFYRRFAPLCGFSEARLLRQSYVFSGRACAKVGNDAAPA